MLIRPFPRRRSTVHAVTTAAIMPSLNPLEKCRRTYEGGPMRKRLLRCAAIISLRNTPARLSSDHGDKLYCGDNLSVLQSERIAASDSSRIATAAWHFMQCISLSD